MTERERWTVYPLLFLSLGIALRSHITSSLDLHEISCQTLKCRELEIDGGALTLVSAEGRPEVMLQATPRGGLVEIGSPVGKSQVVMAVAPLGGVVETFDSRGQLVRTLAVRVNPFAVGKVGPPPAQPAEEPSSETPAPDAEKPPAADEPAGEKPPGTNEPPSEKPAEKPVEAPAQQPVDR